MPKRNNAVTWDIMQSHFISYNDHQLHAVISLKDRLDEQRLEEAASLTANAIPIIKSRLVENVIRARWEEIQVENFVSLCEVDDPESEINNFITDMTDEYTGPQVRIKIVRAPSSDTMCVLMNHMICDGAGFKEYLYFLSDTYVELTKDPGYKPKYTCGNRRMDQVFHAYGGPLRRLKLLLIPDGLSKHICAHSFPLEGDRSSPFIITRSLSRSRMQLIKEYGKARKATINDIILTAYVRSLSNFLHLEDGCNLTIPCAVDLRKYLPQRTAQGICNLTSTIACDIKLDSHDSFDGTLQKVKHSMDMEKCSLACLSGPLKLEILFSMLPLTLFKRLVSRVFINPKIFMTNIGIIDHTKLNFGCSVSTAYITGSIKYNPYFQLALTSFDDEITFSVNFHGTQNDRTLIESFLSSVESELPE